MPTPNTMDAVVTVSDQQALVEPSGWATENAYIPEGRSTVDGCAG
jgi:hypothetical protein